MMQGWGGPREARKAIVESRARYLQNRQAAAESTPATEA